MTATTLTVTFTARRVETQYGDAYKVPKLKSSHLSFSTPGSTVARAFAHNVDDSDMVDLRMRKWFDYPGDYWAVRVYADASMNCDTRWIITPLKGMMARVSITLMERE